jgi:acyl-CoA thioester hydrolase
MQDFTIERKVYYRDTDAGGVVYYATYLGFFEEGRTELCLSRGVDTRELMARGIVFPVVHVEADYKSPARYGDIIRIVSRVERIGTSSITFTQEIQRAGQLLVSARTVWACVDVNRRGSVPVPADIAAKLSGQG